MNKTIEIRAPKILGGESSTEGQITEFVVSEGDVISSDQLLTKLSVGEVKIMEEIAISRESVGGTDMGSRINKADVIGHMRKAGQATVKQYELPRSVARTKCKLCYDIALPLTLKSIGQMSFADSYKYQR
ncbi:2-oxoglutarate dehydrogenase, E2 component, dihydrolipoamide succinyltransferase, putative [Brugia malayi]|uniref:2-oxoglutarate dehydrogenase, E2 component, dihydrolipoamide succinyltransferase, putative n=1 Tax=Brugia malayi TaxID=6279 RepID=A0A0K0JZE6_BRUMA|nr:2-oxoglutarate dehydrogenase, E2 component, dihydrolipoamide succinyltransferase, putative [Brugia malayi]CDQ03722.1 Bm9470 [Brugia malayi]VIO99651.1 2-oxoglutarate dehydrogenase, E2 component, dihydrolipoamide succinyltransferase, putative [Brugia malayi]